MTTQEHLSQHTDGGSRSEVALGYAIMGVWGMVMGLVIAWIF